MCPGFELFSVNQDTVGEPSNCCSLVWRKRFFWRALVA